MPRYEAQSLLARNLLAGNGDLRNRKEKGSGGKC
jgi:hypothetical protein